MNYNRTNIIASLATTPGISAISIIRISGNDLLPLIQQITGKENIKVRYATYSTILSKNQKTVLDKCILIYYKGPYSYTGEDVVEINCHGGHIVSQSILNMLYSHGVQSALPGEFSYRAFINNKIDLIEAEAISSLIHSSSEYSNEIIIDHLNKSLTNQILAINTEIINILTIIEHELDFSEDEIDYTTNESILEILDNILVVVTGYLKNKKLVKTINNGVNVVILGVPNAGKSSLFNKLMGKKRTIVSDISGTTRDAVEARITIGQYPINLIDTAGYFEANDQINIESVEQTIDNAKSADIIIYLDESDPVKAFNKLNVPSDHIIFCKSKQDHRPKEINDDLLINISTEKNYGINSLINELLTILSTNYSYDFSKDKILISDRQIVIFENVVDAINNIKKLAKEDVGMDIIASNMHELIDLFDECLGKISNEDVLTSIFDNFCVGK